MKEFKKVIVEAVQDSIDLTDNQVSISVLNNLLDEILPEQLRLYGVVNSVYVVTERDNYGEQLFKQVFANKDKAVGYLAEQGLKEGNVDEITEIELD